MSTTAIADAPLYWLQIEPSDTNGLKATSLVVADKMVAVPRDKCGALIG